jgi:hypothetical protein
MSRKELTVNRFTEIKRQLELKIPVIQIATNMKCTERTVRLIRDGALTAQIGPKVIAGPTWAELVSWPVILQEALDGHPFSLIWSDMAREKVGYKAFLDQFHKKYPHYKKAFVVHRFFDPGERCEVDYAGDKIQWIDIKTGEINDCAVFVGILGFCQKIFADVTVDQKGDNFVRSHVRMYKYFGGVPKITVPDCLKQGVIRCHRYDPEINRSYQAMAQDFGTVIVPARPRHPKDKSLVEGAVKIIMRLFWWRYRRHTFTSLAEINAAILVCCAEVNDKLHTRFKVSRNQYWQTKELSALKALPVNDYQVATYKTGTVWDDGHVVFEHSYYSVPHQYRGESVDIKASDKLIEIYFKSERIAVHGRSRRARCELITDLSHLPDNARAYHEATPQNILSQARFLSLDLAVLIDGMFKENALGHLRRAQGLLRVARIEIEKCGAEAARMNIKTSIEAMQLYNRVRVPYFQEVLNRNRSAILQSLAQGGAAIVRRPNPNLRHIKKAQMELVINNPT